MKRFLDSDFKKIFFVILLIILVGCTQSRNKDDENQRKAALLENKDDPYIIFYTDETGSIIQNFQGDNPDLNIEYHLINASMDSINGMNAKIATVGQPDLLVLCLGGNIEQTVAIQEEYAADIMEFLEEDTTIDLNDYLPGTFEFLKDSSGLKGVPLGISLPAMTIREEKWKGSAFEALGDSYSTMELLNAMESEIDKALEENSMFVAEDYGFLSEMLNRMGAIQQTEDGVLIDEEIFARLYSIFLKLQKLEKAVREELLATGQNIYGKTQMTGLDPSNYAGRFFASGWTNGAPQVYLTYAASVNMEFFNQRTHTVYYPAGGTDDELGAQVQVVGIVNKNSNRQQEAYDLLRTMMDTPIDSFVQPGGHNMRGCSGNTYFTANIENMYAMIEDFEEYSENWFGDNEEAEEMSDTLVITDGIELIYIIEKVSLDEEEKEKLKEALGNISFLYRIDDTDIRSLEITGRYIKDGIEDYTGCYAEFVELYNTEKGDAE